MVTSVKHSIPLKPAQMVCTIPVMGEYSLPQFHLTNGVGFQSACVSVIGLDAVPVDVEVDIASGLERITLVGLPDTNHQIGTLAFHQQTDTFVNRRVNHSKVKVGTET